MSLERSPCSTQKNAEDQNISLQKNVKIIQADIIRNFIKAANSVQFEMENDSTYRINLKINAKAIQKLC